MTERRENARAQSGEAANATSGPHALGLRVKLGWAVGIIVSQTDEAPEPVFISRCDMRFAASDGVFAYHAAIDAAPPDRSSVVAEAEAEAELLQDALAEAAEDLGLPCHRVTFAEAESSDAWAAVSAWHRDAGRPWQKDHKLAAAAAWTALTSGPRW